MTRCPRCQSRLYQEQDEEHGFLAIKCHAGHLLGYQATVESTLIRTGTLRLSAAQERLYDLLADTTP